MGLLASSDGTNIYPYPYETMFNIVTEALLESGFKIVASDEFNGTINAKSKMSFKSWGEAIVVSLRKTPHGIQVVISSQAYQLYDWGKSENNIKKFFNILNYKVMNLK